ncbi:hypothetical protein ACVWV0_002932 [Ewingella americana]|uniref:Uncharacterized protein n=2 Tax=Ewingella americana TaxID=41202 RepID=A0A085GNY4_EWIA3|nr:hypothetical protein F4W05_20805 [Ewingella americana]KFC85429.1 hypothetical protein GEAM_0394 [Ewingella americana ATCC 33852]PKB86272.1 hypothetical protein A8A01_28730 [Ewingella americana]STQ46162.1 Uncharacterised protein [Ewingella americana]
MKKTISIIAIIVLSILSIYALIDLIESAYLVMRYEHFDARSSGNIFGKFIFIVISCFAIRFILKWNRKKSTS